MSRQLAAEAPLRCIADRAANHASRTHGMPRALQRVVEGEALDAAGGITYLPSSWAGGWDNSR
jgi:hypothetical protein